MPTAGGGDGFLGQKENVTVTFGLITNATYPHLLGMALTIAVINTYWRNLRLILPCRYLVDFVDVGL